MFSSYAPPVVLIVGEPTPYLAKALPSLFSKAGANVIFASPETCSLRSSRFINETVTLDPYHTDAVENLEKIVTAYQPAHVVIVGEHLVERIHSLPADKKSVFQHIIQLPEEFDSRSSFHQWATAREIPMPEGEICKELAAAHQALARWGTVFLKKDGSSGGLGVRKASTPDQVDAAFRELNQPGGILVQKALDGRVGVTDMVVHEGKLQAWIASEKWRTLRPYGPSISRRLCVPDGMEELAMRVARETGFHGLCGFDWVIDTADGLPRLIEFHPRPPSGYGLGKWAGVDFSKAVAPLIGTGAPGYQAPDPDRFSKKPVCCYFPDHPITSIKRREWTELLHWLPGTASRSWSLLPWDDLPFLFSILVKRPFKSITRRLSPRIENEDTDGVVVHAVKARTFTSLLLLSSRLGDGFFIA